MKSEQAQLYIWSEDIEVEEFVSHLQENILLYLGNYVLLVLRMKWDVSVHSVNELPN